MWPFSLGNTPARPYHPHKIEDESMTDAGTTTFIATSHNVRIDTQAGNRRACEPLCILASVGYLSVPTHSSNTSVSHFKSRLHVYVRTGAPVANNRTEFLHVGTSIVSNSPRSLNLVHRISPTPKALTKSHCGDFARLPNFCSFSALSKTNLPN